MVIRLLRGGTARAQGKYISGRRKIPMKPPRRPTREDELFGDIRRSVLKPQPREQHQNAWISKETWRLVDERVTMRRKSRARTGLWKLGRDIQASMKEDRKRRVEEAETAIEVRRPLELRSSGSRRSKRNCISGYHPLHPTVT